MCRIINTRKVTINNIPDIIDVNKLITLLGNLGVKIKNGHGSLTFQADDGKRWLLRNRGIQKRRRQSSWLYHDCWSIVSPFRKRLHPKPGGDKIGRRRLDTHTLKGLLILVLSLDTKEKTISMVLNLKAN